MNIVTPAVLESFAADLARRGLPVEYSRSAAEELADHYRDLVVELRDSGLDEAAANREVGRRLGDARTLVKKTASEFRRRHWCGRWPLVSFLLAPVPAFWAVCFIACWVSIQTYEALSRMEHWLGMTEPMPATIAIFKLVLLGGASAAFTPLALTFLFYRLARRSGCNRRWALAAIGQIAFLASLMCFHVDRERGLLFFEPALLYSAVFAPTFATFLKSYFVQPSQIFQFAAPLAAFGFLVWKERQRQRIAAASIGLLALS